MKVLEGKIVKGQITSTGSWTTDKIHALRADNKKLTLCGVKAYKSDILGFPRKGDLDEVNCKKCRKIINNYMEEVEGDEG